MTPGFVFVEFKVFWVFLWLLMFLMSANMQYVNNRTLNNNNNNNSN